MRGPSRPLIIGERITVRWSSGVLAIQVSESLELIPDAVEMNHEGAFGNGDTFFGGDNISLHLHGIIPRELDDNRSGVR